MRVCDPVEGFVLSNLGKQSALGDAVQNEKASGLCSSPPHSLLLWGPSPPPSSPASTPNSFNPDCLLSSLGTQQDPLGLPLSCAIALWSDSSSTEDSPLLHSVGA